MELRGWLEENASLVVNRWHAEIEVRWGSQETEEDSFLYSLLHHLVTLLPACLGNRRGAAEELWEQGTHLYGSYAVRRGLSAGEVVEELQILRGTVLRLLFAEPPAGSTGLPVPGREILALNGVLDLGVARASVAYVDDLFFAHLQGSGVPEGTTPEVEAELRRQLEAQRQELESG
ncbi:hypothetical protein ACFL3S_01590 [Gemmatimonadota bacterium]